MKHAFWALKNALFVPLFYFLYLRCKMDEKTTRWLIIWIMVIAAVAGRLLWVVIGRWLVSAGGGWERFEALERCLELGDPRPGVL